MSRALDTLAYPLRGDHRGDALGAVWALFLAHGFVPFVAVLPVVGVSLRVLAGSAVGEVDPPAVAEDVSSLLRRSVGGAILSLLYLGPPIAYLLLVLEVVSNAGSVRGGSLPVLAAATIGGIWVLVSTYLLPVALACYGRSGSLRVAFDRERLRRGARSGSYLLGWLAGVVVVDVGGLLAAWVGTTSPVRAVSAALIAAYALVVGARTIGLGLRGAGVVAASTVPADENP